MITTICMLARDQDLRITRIPTVANGNVNTVGIDVKTDQMWDGLLISAVFFNSEKGPVYEVLLKDGKCIVPHEVLDKKVPLFIGIRGVASDRKKVSTVVSYKDIRWGAPESNATAEGPTPDVYQQILKRLDEIDLGVPDEQIEEAVTKYLENNPVNVVVDDAFSEGSENPVQNKVIAKEVREIKTEIGNIKGNIGEAKAVLYKEQTLTDAQKTQARTNIGAASADVVRKLSEQIDDHQNYYQIVDDGAVIQNGINAKNNLWTKWNARLAFGMDTSTANVPFLINHPMYVSGTLMVHNTSWPNRNRWGFHVFEAYAKDCYSRMTMLLDKHENEGRGKPSLEMYYYTGASHDASAYGNTKIGSDVLYHSFCFDRDVMTAYGEIDAKMPITLARISLSKDIDSSYDTVSAADAAFEPEIYAEENNKCLKYIALNNAENGAMFYDTDRDKAVIKVNGIWCDLPVEPITDDSYSIFGTPCTGLELSSTTLTFNGAGTQVLTATKTPSNASGTVRWTSDNTSIATVNNGVVTAVNNGTTTVTATCGSQSASCVVTVTGIGEIEVQWESGALNNDGSNMALSGRIRTVTYIPDNVQTIIPSEGYEICIYVYHGDESFWNFYDTSTNEFSVGAVYTGEEISITDVRNQIATKHNDSNSNTKKFRVIARKTNSSAITPTEGAENITFE